MIQSIRGEVQCHALDHQKVDVCMGVERRPLEVSVNFVKASDTKITGILRFHEDTSGLNKDRPPQLITYCEFYSPFLDSP